MRCAYVYVYIKFSSNCSFSSLLLISIHLDLSEKKDRRRTTSMIKCFLKKGKIPKYNNLNSIQKWQQKQHQQTNTNANYWFEANKTWGKSVNCVLIRNHRMLGVYIVRSYFWEIWNRSVVFRLSTFLTRIVNGWNGERCAFYIATSAAAAAETRLEERQWQKIK